MPRLKWDGTIDGWRKRKTVLAFSNERIYIMQRDDPMHTPIPRLDDFSEVEIMVVARPMRGAEGMGAAAVGPGHHATTYTGVRGPEQPQGEGRPRGRDRLRGQEIAARRTAYTASDAPGVAQEDRDPTGLIRVKSTNSPSRVELPPTPPRSRRRDRTSYSPITGSSDEEPPQSTRKLDLEVPADAPDGDSYETVCNLAALTKSRRKVVLNGRNQLGEQDMALRTLFFPEQCCVTCGPKHAVAITSHPSAFQDPTIHCLDIGEAGTGHWDASLIRSTLQEISPSYHHCIVIPFMG